MTRKINLRYGENPHQQGWVKRVASDDGLAWFKYQQLQGKQLSFNNYLDIDAAVECLCFIGQTQPACVVVKHANPCGAGRGRDLGRVFKIAWEGDSLAAFGGIVAVNRRVEAGLAKIMLADRRFFEVLVCPGISKQGLAVMNQKKNLRVLVNPALRRPKPNKAKDFRRIRGGILEQEADVYQLKSKDLKVMTKRKPTKRQMEDMLMAWDVCRVSKANSIAMVKNQQLVANGVGQQDRVRCCQLAVSKAKPGAVKESVAASDAYFPFKDGPEVLVKAGVKAIMQPGGSIRDQETIDLCNQYQVAMVFTGVRCFKH